MKEIGKSEARTHFSALIRRVRKGEFVLITERGRAVARLVPFVALEDADGRLARLERAGRLRRAVASAPSKLILNTPPVKPRKEARALKFLLEDRREGR